MASIPVNTTYSKHLCNLLPDDIMKSTEITMFKKSIKKMERA